MPFGPFPAFAILVATLVAAPLALDPTAFRSLDLKSAKPDDLLKAFGRPMEFRQGRDVLDPAKLPTAYEMVYPGDVTFTIESGEVVAWKVRAPGLRTIGDLEVGQSMDAAWRVLGGRPRTERKGGLSTDALAPETLYLDLDGISGRAAFYTPRFGLRLDFQDQRIAGLSRERSPRQVGKFMDVRNLDLRLVATSELLEKLPTLSFNQDTKWPVAVQAAAETRLRARLDPGLGVRTLHAQGIRGRGVRVGIIDQAMSGAHAEYKGRITPYQNFGNETAPSMHGPAVASLLAGKTAGVAPDCQIVFAAVNMSQGDALPFADALRWILAQNLPGLPPIRVVSVSAAPGNPNAFRNADQWAAAVEEANRAGVLVLDCTSGTVRVGPAWFGTDPQRADNLQPGFPGRPFATNTNVRAIFAPASDRTMAEETSSGGQGFQFSGQGGLSWAVPYVAGVLALGQQVAPTASASALWDTLWATGHERGGFRFVAPVAFLERLKLGSARP